MQDMNLQPYFDKGVQNPTRQHSKLISHEDGAEERNSLGGVRAERFI